ncbi:MAG: hypothetical protein V1837_06560 [Candidatus Woesearchaeota archaeon]
MQRAQTAIEYLIIVGFALSVIAVLTIVYYEHDASSKNEIISSQVSSIERKIVDSAESVYYLGAPTRTTLKIYMPSNIEKVIISSREVNFQVHTKEGISDLEVMSAVNLTGNISASPGLKYIKIISQPGRTCIVEEGNPDCP